MWKAQEKRLKKMQQNITASKEAYEARVNQVENDFKDKEGRVAALSVKAPNSGIVQEFTLKLGQKVNEGDKIAIVVSPESLIAELQIQELQIRDVVLGQKVMVDTRSSKIEGKVIRIDPAVIEGEVQVDVSLSGQLPPEARSDLNVDGLIAITDIENALFIKRPSFAQRYTSVSLYRISNDGRFATKVPVEFGQSSINQIQIVNGLSQGERLVISDTTSWEQHAEILIN